MDKTIIAGLREYFLQCPLLGENPLGVDYLPNKGEAYSIGGSPVSEVLQKFLRGGFRKQYSFEFRSVKDYGIDEVQNIDNSGFFEKLSEWLAEQSANKNYPQIGDTRQVELIEAQGTGYLFETDANTGKYQIQCRIVYRERKKYDSK